MLLDILEIFPKWSSQTHNGCHCFSGGEGAKVRKCWILLAAPPCSLFAPLLCAFVNLMSTLATSIMSDHKSGPDLDSYLPTMWL